MEKDQWIADKIKKLLAEGKEQAQAAAIAESMWSAREKAVADEPPKSEDDSEDMEPVPDDEAADQALIKQFSKKSFHYKF